MASFWYDLGLQAFAAAAVNWGTGSGGDTIKFMLVQITGGGTPYTANQSTDQFVTDIPSGAIAARSPAMTTKVLADGILGAADFVFSTVTFAHACGALVVYKDTGSDATSPLLMYLDSANYSGLPITPSGGNINVTLSPTGNLIASL